MADGSFPFNKYAKGLVVPRVLWCVECNTPSHQQFWHLTEADWCETCGGHEFTMCPNTHCMKVYDPYIQGDHVIEELLRHSDPTRRKHG